MTVRGYKREGETWDVLDTFDRMRADYSMAKTGRFRRRLTGVHVMGSGADYHYRTEPHFLRMIEQAREYDRNDMVVGAGVTRLVQNVMQDGFRLDVRTGDDELNAAIGEKWEAWTTDTDACDVAGEMNFDAMAEAVLRATVVDGDLFALPLSDGRLEHVEGHRCRTPRNTKRNVVHGVLLNEMRQHLEYWFTKEDLDPTRPLHRVGDMRRVAVRNGDGRRQAWQIKHPRRLSQTRGVSAFAPIVNAIGMHDDLEFAKLVQAQIVSCFALIHERELDFAGGTSPQTGAQSTNTDDGSSRTIENISPGMRVFGAPGEKIGGFTPSVPNPEFFQHAMLILTFIAVNLNLPLQVMLLDPRQTNFSGWRGAMDQARLGFRSFQKWLVSAYHRRVYLWKLASWVREDGALRKLAGRSDVRLTRHRWNPPSWPYIEPHKDANADAVRLNNRLISPRRVHAERGRDFEEVAAEIVEDNALIVTAAIERAEQINEAHPAAKVDWRELAAFNMKGAKPQSGNQSTRVNR
jgi:lambda family phage portal protein